MVVISFAAIFARLLKSVKHAFFSGSNCIASATVNRCSPGLCHALHCLCAHGLRGWQSVGKRGRWDAWRELWLIEAPYWEANSVSTMQQSLNYRTSHLRFRGFC